MYSSSTPVNSLANYSPVSGETESRDVLYALSNHPNKKHVYLHENKNARPGQYNY